MIRSYLITAAISLSFGAIGGYTLQKLEVSSGPVSQTRNDEAIAASPKKPSRDELITKLSLCVNRKLDKAFTDSVTDKQLNDITFEYCKK